MQDQSLRSGFPKRLAGCRLRLFTRRNWRWTRYALFYKDCSNRELDSSERKFFSGLIRMVWQAARFSQRIRIV